MKKFLLCAASLFLAYQSYKVCSMIGQVKLDFWFLGILLVIIMNLLVTGVFAFLGFALPTQKLLPQWVLSHLSTRDFKNVLQSHTSKFV